MAEILLVKSVHPAVGAEEAVIPLDEKKLSVADGTRLNVSDIESNCASEPHNECFVLGRAIEPFDGRLEDVCGGLSRCRQCNRVVHENHRHLRLRTG